MQGVSPGLTVISRPGNVGSDLGSINIRGRGNLGASSPLYVVDGIPVSASDFQRINPSDVESISVLKDAAAASIYGSRAAFGVLLVTTKKGADGKARFSYNTYYGVQTPTVLPKILGSEDYANLLNEANINARKTAIYSEEELAIIKNGSQPDLYPDNDWYDLVYRSSAPMTEHNFSVSGGGDTRYFVSGTFFDQSSLVPDAELERYSFRANTERDFGDIFTLGTNISYIREDIERAGNFSITDLNRMTPLTVANHSDAIDLIRKRAGMPVIDRNVVNSKPALRALIRNERRIELAGEGFRWDDIRRWGISSEVMNSIYSIDNSLAQERRWEPRFIRFPYPQTAIDRNPNLKEAQETKGY